MIDSHRHTFVVSLTVLWLASTGLIAGERQDWTYDGDRGPEYWGQLADEYEMCGQGRNQSPIDLKVTAHSDLPELVFEYSNPGRFEEVNTGHTIMETVNPGNYLSILDERFELKQFHFHSPSEHTVEGRSFPMEVHLVHSNDGGDLAVIGLFLAEGPHNEMMDKLPLFRANRGEEPYSEPLDYNEFFPHRRDYFYYNGSLTTPPCSEGVAWIVLKEPVVAAPEQIQLFHDLLGLDNNRPIQPRNSRLVVD